MSFQSFGRGIGVPDGVRGRVGQHSAVAGADGARGAAALGRRQADRHVPGPVRVDVDGPLPVLPLLGALRLALAAREQTMWRAYIAHPERFVQGPPQPPDLPSEVWINPPRISDKSQHDPLVISPGDTKSNSVRYLQGDPRCRCHL